MLRIIYQLSIDLATSDSQASRDSAGMHKLTTTNKFSPTLLKLQEKNSSGKRYERPIGCQVFCRCFLDSKLLMQRCIRLCNGVLNSTE